MATHQASSHSAAVRISSIKTESLETHIWGGAKAIPVSRQGSLLLKEVLSRRLKASTTTRVCTLQFLASVNLLKSPFRPRPNSHFPASRVIWSLGKKLISISSSTVFLHQARLHHSCAWASEQDDESVRSDRWTLEGLIMSRPVTSKRPSIPCSLLQTGSGIWERLHTTAG